MSEPGPESHPMTMPRIMRAVSIPEPVTGVYVHGPLVIVRGESGREYVIFGGPWSEL